MNQEFKDRVKKFWLTANTYIICAIIAALVGIGIGIKVSKVFYADKMKDSILVGGFVFENKPYALQPK